jgi:hypothetical protein
MQNDIMPNYTVSEKKFAGFSECHHSENSKLPPQTLGENPLYISYSQKIHALHHFKEKVTKYL